MKQNKILPLAFGMLFILLIGLSKNSAASTEIVFNVSTFFPLNPDRVYTYQKTGRDDSTEIFQKRVEHPILHNSIPVTIIPITKKDREGIIAEVTYFRADGGNGLLIYGKDDVEAGCTERYSPPLAISDNLALGQYTSLTSDVTVTGIGEACLPATTVIYTVTFVQLESITVPAGTFHDCARILVQEIWQGNDGNTLLERALTLFFAPDIGIIKEIDVKKQEISELLSIGK